MPVEDIVDALQSVIDFFTLDIEELVRSAIENMIIPLLAMFDLDWIDDVANFLQGVVDLTDAIEEEIKTWLCTGSIESLNLNPIGICFPEFPDIDLMLSFNLEASFNQMLLGIPDFEADFTDLMNSALNLPQNLLDKLGNLSIGSSWLGCADSSTPDAAISCLLSAVDIPISPSSILEEESGTMAIIETLLNPDDVIAEEL